MKLVCFFFLPNLGILMCKVATRTLQKIIVWFHGQIGFLVQFNLEHIYETTMLRSRQTNETVSSMFFWK